MSRRPVHRRRVRLPITHRVVLRLADILSPRCHQSRDGHRRCHAAVVVRSSSTAPTPVVSSCPPTPAHPPSLDIPASFIKKITFFLLLLHLLCGEKTLSEAKYCC
uniref:cDNA clone:J033113K17, full insert sequence n=1 Tax=Oryza sativa subsp. japonica TaxID=39947 RepID=B7ETT2_ORYSJ|nr:unnamed protein product [Oryza sativa Japonica Group]